MTRILATAIAGAIGWLIGMAFMLTLDFTSMPLILMVIFGISGWIASEEMTPGFDRHEIQVLKQGSDMALISAWGAGPALMRISQNEGKYMEQENEILNTSLPLALRVKMYNFENFLMLFRESLTRRAPPEASLRRHNRAFRPHIFRKKSASYTVLLHVARATIAAGADRNGAIWFYYVASKLKIKPKDAYEFMARAFNEQRERPSMIPSMPSEKQALFTAANEVPPKFVEDLEPYLVDYERSRAEIIDLLFPG